jgi:hypothetical protein
MVGVSVAALILYTFGLPAFTLGVTCYGHIKDKLRDPTVLKIVGIFYMEYGKAPEYASGKRVRIYGISGISYMEYGKAPRPEGCLGSGGALGAERRGAERVGRTDGRTKGPQTTRVCRYAARP